jgi:hypothetical protein
LASWNHLVKCEIYLLFSASFGKLIVNLQSDARKEFKGSTAWRTPHAWEFSHGNHQSSLWGKGNIVENPTITVQNW